MQNLTSPKIVKEICNKHKFRFNKKYGQNFLIDNNIIDKILMGANISDNDYVLEIGPGMGTMTQYLCESAKYVLAVEIDSSLIPILNETLYKYDNIKIINSDFMKINLKEELKKISDNKFKVIANLPYYLTTPIITSLLESTLPLKSITIMIQKEVAERIVANPGTKDYGALSIVCQFYSKPKIISIVPKSVFIPQPKVDSCIINMEILEKPSVEVSNKKLYFRVVRAAFNMRRKTLLNSLSNGLNIEKSIIKEVLEKNNIDPIRRGETLSLDEFASIANRLGKLESRK